MTLPLSSTFYIHITSNIMPTQQVPQTPPLGRALICLSKKADHWAEKLHKDEPTEAQTPNPQHSKRPSANLSGPTLAADPESILTANEEARVKSWLEAIPVVLIDPHTTHQLQQPKTLSRKVDVACQTDVVRPAVSPQRYDARFHEIEGPTQIYAKTLGLPPPPQTQYNIHKPPAPLRINKAKNRAPLSNKNETCVEEPEGPKLNPAGAPYTIRPEPPSTSRQHLPLKWHINVNKIRLAANRNNKTPANSLLAPKAKHHTDKIQEPDLTHSQPPPPWLSFNTATIGRKQGLAFLAMSNEGGLSPSEEHDQDAINEAVRSLKTNKGPRREARKTLEDDSDEFISKLKALELEQKKGLGDVSEEDEDSSPGAEQEQTEEAERSVPELEKDERSVPEEQMEEENRKAYFQERAEVYADRYAKCKPLNYEGVKRDFDYVQSDIKKVCDMAGEIHNAWKKRQREKEMERKD